MPKGMKFILHDITSHSNASFILHNVVFKTNSLCNIFTHVQNCCTFSLSGNQHELLGEKQFIVSYLDNNTCGLIAHTFEGHAITPLSSGVCYYRCKSSGQVCSMGQHVCSALVEHSNTYKHTCVSFILTCLSKRPFQEKDLFLYISMT